jgi:hypothetical protein
MLIIKLNKTMLELQEDFANEALGKIREVYFPTVNTRAGDKEWNSDKVYQKYGKAKYQIELLSNGCMHYAKFIEKLAKLCNDTNVNIHKLIENYVVSFGGYKYKPSKTNEK